MELVHKKKLIKVFIMANFEMIKDVDMLNKLIIKEINMLVIMKII